MATRFATMVTLMAGVPLDPLYKHTLTFANFAAQTTYFESKRVFTPATFNFISYQRHNSGVIKLEAPINILGTVNYLSFVNANYQGQGNLHEAKTFYAFITDIAYISDTVVAISYSIDVLQTWMFDYTVNPCYVEREHANSDNLGDNRVDEGLETGEYICAGVEQILPWTFADTAFILQATQSPIGGQHTSVEGNVYSSLYLKVCPTVAVLENELDNFKQGATQSLEPIISISQFPKRYLDENEKPTYREWDLTLDQSIGLGPFMAVDPASTQQITYTPKNNKLYGYPYNYMVFESPDGSSNILKFENFLNNNIHKFWSLLSIYPEVETMCAPENYESTTYIVNFRQALYCKNYPVCGVASDSYQAWLAQNKFSMPIAMAMVEGGALGGGTTISGTHGGSHHSGKIDQGALEAGSKLLRQVPIVQGLDLLTATGKAYMDNRTIMSDMITAGKGVSMIGDVLSGDFGSVGDVAREVGLQLASIAGHKAVPDTAVTKSGAAGILHNAALDNYKIYYTKIRPEYAEIIDNYFTCFGYATHVVKVPNTTGRRNWNYVKTVGCTISGNIPSEAEDKITAIFDRGVTFWHDPSTIHNYSANNDIV